MSRVRGVLIYAGCFAEAVGSVDRVNGWEAGLHDGLGFFTTLCREGAECSVTVLARVQRKINFIYGRSIQSLMAAGKNLFLS